MKTSNLGLSAPKYCRVVSHCVDSHLLQKEAALMRAGGGSRGSHLWWWLWGGPCDRGMVGDGR